MTCNMRKCSARPAGGNSKMGCWGMDKDSPPDRRGRKFADRSKSRHYTTARLLRRSPSYQCASRLGARSHAEVSHQMPMSTIAQ